MSVGVVTFGILQRKFGDKEKFDCIFEAGLECE